MDEPEETDESLVGSVDEQVGDDVAIPIESGQIQFRAEVPRSAGLTDWFPAPTVVPICIVPVRVAAAVGVEVQVRNQLETDTTVHALAPHVRRRIGIGGLIGGYVTRERIPDERTWTWLGIYVAIAISVEANDIQLAEFPNLDQAVIIDVVVSPDRHLEGLRRGEIRPTGIGGRDRDGRGTNSQRRKGYYGTRWLRRRHLLIG